MEAENSREMIEHLAEIEHERWAHWQSYLHQQGVLNDDGSLTLPAELVSRWTRLINTPYPDLTQEERESDREQVRRYLPAILDLVGGKGSGGGSE